MENLFKSNFSFPVIQCDYFKDDHHQDKMCASPTIVLQFLFVNTNIPIWGIFKNHSTTPTPLLSSSKRVAGTVSPDLLPLRQQMSKGSSQHRDFK